ncbi:MAG: Gfo/Idh/MocA family oxidoreductase [Clostridia bacterium]|nr:Gfo/Idh/MocA family oxidoreductase [Clostridia bacterium]
MSRVFNWAFIGAGRLADEVAKEITASGRHKIVSVYTRNPEKCKAFAAKYGAFAVDNAREAMDRTDIDGVYIVTPHTSHAEYALLAMDLGKPVLCEKPVTTDAKLAAEMIHCSREKGIYFAEAMWTWFSPIANQVKCWLDRGEYGEILSCHMSYHLNSINYAPRVSDPNVAGGALLDVAIYPITYIYRLFGKPSSISCQGILKDGIDTGEEIVMTYPGGKQYTASVSIVDYKGLEMMELRGTKAVTKLPFFHAANAVRICRFHAKNRHLRAYGGKLVEFDIAASEIRHGLTESRYVPHQATLDVMNMLDDCRRQMGLVYPFEKA